MRLLRAIGRAVMVYLAIIAVIVAVILLLAFFATYEFAGPILLIGGGFATLTASFYHWEK